ncbi:hypothetical protein EDD85DRAFT_769504, partial [Armillaria nabsnona]
QCCLTVNIHHAADDKPDRFEVADIHIHLDHLQNEGLKETLKRVVLPKFSPVQDRYLEP